MPAAPPRPCTHPGCGAYAVKGGRCERHPVPHQWDSTPRPNARQRYGSGWDKIRSRVLKRDGYMCQPCYILGRPTKATEVDHVIPKAEGGTDDDWNLQAICTTCHRKKTHREAARGRRGGSESEK